MRETITQLLHTHSYLAQGQPWMAKLHEYEAEMIYLAPLVHLSANQTCTALNFILGSFLRTDMALILASCRTYRLFVRTLYDTTWHHEGRRWTGKTTTFSPQQQHNIELRVRHTLQQLLASGCNL